MKIKEVEELLSISRANIRYYEKEGLLTTFREANNYREYSEENICELRKIILFRKMGFTVDEIRRMQRGELTLNDAANANILRLQEQIETLEGALELTRMVSVAEVSYEEIDGDYYSDIVSEKEKRGIGFVDFMNDYLAFELDRFDTMWKWVFFFDFKSLRQKRGTCIAVAVMLLICVVRGLSKIIFDTGTFWEGFLYPFFIFFVGSLLILPLFLLSRKYPKVASVIATVLGIVGVLFLASLVIFILVLLLNQVFHFWF